MGERWVTLQINDDETLRCISCAKYLHNQKVHLYLDVDNELDEIQCDTCWKKNKKEND